MHPLPLTPHFDHFSISLLGSRTKLFRILVEPPIPNIPYRKLSVTYHFLGHINNLADTEAFETENLLATVSLYFEFYTGVVEIESEYVIAKIYSKFFNVGNLTSIGFCDSRNKLVTVDNVASTQL